MASAAATTSLPDAILRTLFNQLPDAKSLQRISGQFGWDLLRNIVLPAAGDPAAKAHSASAVHATTPVRSPSQPAHGADKIPAKPQGKVRVLFDMPPGTRISTHADGTAFQVDVGTGTKTVGGGARAAMSCAGGEGSAAPTAAGATAQAAPAGAASTDATPADPTRLNSPQTLKAMTDLQTQLASKFKDVLTPESEYRLLQSPERNIKSKFDAKTQTVSVLEDENGILYKEGETAKSGAKYVPVDFVAFYKDLLYVTKGVPYVLHPDGPNASTAVQDFFSDHVPLIPEEGKPASEGPPYRSTFFEEGKVDDGQGNDLRALSHEDLRFKELNAIYFNSGGGAAIGVGDNISAALTLLHEIDHAIGFAQSNVGEWVLHHTLEHNDKTYSLEDLEEERVMTGVDPKKVYQYIGQHHRSSLKPEVDKVLEMKEGQGLENDTAKRLGEIQRKSHYGSLKIVPADPDDPNAHTPVKKEDQ